MEKSGGIAQWWSTRPTASRCQVRIPVPRDEAAISGSWYDFCSCPDDKPKKKTVLFVKGKNKLLKKRIVAELSRVRLDVLTGTFENVFHI